MEELKPCPFCGGEAYVAILMNNTYVEARHTKKCLIKPNTWLQSGEPIKRQIRAWNKRKC